MNRHSPLFRVALTSLALALSLPLLVFLAANVRHRQLQSKSNPRWAKFAEVNSSRMNDSPQAPRVTEDAPRAAASAAKGSDPVLANGQSETEMDSSNRLNARPVSNSSGLTGSATEIIPKNPLGAEQEPKEFPTNRTPAPKVGRSAVRLPVTQQQTAELTPTTPSRTVPEPDDEPEAARPSRPMVTTKPFVVLRPGENENFPSDSSSGRLEARLAGLQRKIDQLAQAQVDKQISDLDRAWALLQQAQQAQQAQQNQQPNQNTNPRPFDSQDAPPTASPQPGSRNGPPAPPLPADDVAPRSGNRDSRGREPTIKIIQGDSQEGDERFSIQVQDANLTEVLEMLGQLAGVNILASREIQGRLSLNLQDVTVDRALDAIVKSQGFVYERDGDFIYVRTSVEDAAIKQVNRKLISKVYQLHYINANEVQKLLDPVLTKGVGRHAVTSPSQVGIAQSPSTAGGDGLSQRDTLVVQDFPEVIAEVDRIILEIDVPPLQVMIEAKILSVALSDSLQFGVNFAMLNGDKTSQLLTGNGSTLNGSVGFPKSPALVPAAGDFVANTAGLKYGFVAGDISTFIEALQNIADTTLVASPNLRVLNKQKAEMIIGNRVSYKTLAFNGTQTVENVQFLDAGTKLIFRPFISPDGLVRLEVHPERSKATINAQTGLPDQVTTEVTTNVMVRDGTTVVIGGLISEEVTESIDSVPLLGSIPLLGAAFRNKTEQTVRTELIVLITPRIVTEPEACIEGEKLQFETEARAAYFRDNLSPVNRTSLTRAHFERANIYFEQGNLLKAKQQIDAALLQNKGDIECQRLKLKIDRAIHDQQSRAWKWPMGGNRAQAAKSQ